MPFGSKPKNLKQLKADLKKGSGGFIGFIPKEGSLTIRFLTEPEEWVSFTEVFDPVLQKGYPLPEEGQPGYDEELRQSKRYLANVLDVENDKVIALQMPKTLANQIVIRYEKYDTIMDRDYELMRDGAGKDTTYMATPEAPTTRKLAKYENSHLDLEEVLEKAYNAVWDADADEDDDDPPKKKNKRVVDDDEDEDEKPRVKKRTPSSKAPSRRRASHDDDDEDFDAVKKKSSSGVKKRRR